MGILHRKLKIVALSGVLSVLPILGQANTDLSKILDDMKLSGSFLASRIAINDNDDKAAVLFLEQTLKLDPENPGLLQDYFISLVKNGRIDDAAAIAAKSDSLGGNNNLAALVLGVDALKKRSWNQAIESIGRLKGVDLEKTFREILIGWALAGEGKVDEALQRIDELSGPEWLIALKLYHGGLVAAAAGRNGIAKEKFQAVIDKRTIISILTETYIRAIEAKIRNDIVADDLDEAIETVDYGLSLIPGNPSFLLLKEKIQKREVVSPLIATPQQGSSELLFNVASAIRRDGSIADAKSYLQLGRFLAPESDVVTIGLAELYLQQRDYERSNSFYKDVKETSPFFRSSQLEMATNLARLERKEEAIELLKQMIESDPDDLDGYMTLGDIFNREKRYREAADIYDRAAAKIDTIEKQHWNLFFRRGIAYERLKEWDKAEPNFKQSLELSPNQAEVLNYLGYSWIDQGVNLEEGMEMIRKAVDLRPRSGFIVDSLGWAYYRLGQYEDAVRELERAVQLMPQDPTINDHLGDAYWRVGRKLEATFQWKIALASKTPPEHPEKIEKKLAEGLAPEEESKAETQ